MRSQKKPHFHTWIALAFCLTAVKPAHSQTHSNLQLPPYEGPPAEYLAQKPDKTLQKNLSWKFFQNAVVNNPGFMGTLAVPPFVQGGKIIGLRVLRNPDYPFWKKAGLKKDDVILAINREDANRLFSHLQKGRSPFEILFLRNGKLHQLILRVNPPATRK